MPMECSNCADSDLSRVTAVIRRREFCLGAAGIDHWFDCEDHAGFQGQATTGCAEMQDCRSTMERLPQPMTGEVAHDGKPFGFGMALDGMPDIAKRVSGPCRLDPEHQAIIGDLGQQPCLYGWLTNKIHPRRVAIPAVKNDCHVDVQDVTVAKRFSPGMP